MISPVALGKPQIGKGFLSNPWYGLAKKTLLLAALEQQMNRKNQTTKNRKETKTKAQERPPPPPPKKKERKRSHATREDEKNTSGSLSNLRPPGAPFEPPAKCAQPPAGEKKHKTSGQRRGVRSGRSGLAAFFFPVFLV